MRARNILGSKSESAHKINKMAIWPYSIPLEVDWRYLEYELGQLPEVLPQGPLPVIDGVGDWEMLDFLDCYGLVTYRAAATSGCTCKRSRCVKKYCPCFTAGEACGGECSCTGCKNDMPTARGAQELPKFCTCKKGCDKMYCVCRQAGRECGAKCRCVGCGNNGVSRLKRKHDALLHGTARVGVRRKVTIGSA